MPLDLPADEPRDPWPYKPLTRDVAVQTSTPPKKRKKKRVKPEKEEENENHSPEEKSLAEDTRKEKGNCAPTVRGALRRRITRHLLGTFGCHIRTTHRTID